MPIIVDPRQNPQERQFGIIEVNGVYCFYDKENQLKRKRYMPNGFFVSSEWIINLKEDKNPNKVILFNGQVLNVKAELDIPTGYNVDADTNQGPVIKELFKFAETKPGGVKDLVDTGQLPTEL